MLPIIKQAIQPINHSHIFDNRHHHLINIIHTQP